MLRPRTVREGSVGLFALLGLVVLGSVAVWLRGGGFGKESYRIFVDFEDASGLQVGGPVRFRGVSIGKVTGLLPGSNGVKAVIDIVSKSVRIPRASTVQISRYGLIGEASIDIIPQEKLSEEALAIAPNSKECQSQKQIICENDRLTGEAGSQLVNSLTKLSNVYSDPAFVGNINSTVRSASQAAARIGKMSDEIALLSKTARYQISGVSRTTAAIAGAADNAGQLTQSLNRVVLMNQASLAKTLTESSKLMNNLNVIINENRGQVASTLGSIQNTSQQIQALSKNLETSVKQLNTGLDAVNTAQLGKNIEVLMANAKETSENLRKISENLNNPTILLTVQQTLDSARATFENAQKITADVEQLTGDPAFRNNLRKLVDGLGSLVSSTESLEKQVYATKVLESASSQLKYQIDVQQRLATFQAEVLAVTPANSESPITPSITIEKNSTPVFLAQPYLKPSSIPIRDRKLSKIN